MPDPVPHASTLARGTTIALIAAAVLSTTAVFIRHLTVRYGIPALVLAFWRDAFVVIALLPALALLRPTLLRVPRRHLRYLISFGLVLAVFNAFWTLSVALNGAAVATVLVYTSTAFTAVLGWLFLSERVSWAKVVAVALAIGGCAFVSGATHAAAWGAGLAGVITGLLSGLGYAAYSLMGRSAAQRGLDAWTTLLYTFAFATPFLGLANLLPALHLPGAAGRPADLLWLGDATVGWLILVLLAVGPTVAGFGLYNVSLTYLPSSLANLIVTLEPAFTVVIAYVLLGERLTAVQFGGGLMIMAAVVLLRTYEGWIAARPRLEPVR